MAAWQIPVSRTSQIRFSNCSRLLKRGTLPAEWTGSKKNHRQNDILKGNTAVMALGMTMRNMKEKKR